MEFEVDPLFSNISKKFAENGGKDLFLHTIPIDYNLDIMLEGSNFFLNEDADNSFDNVNHVNNINSNNNHDNHCRGSKSAMTSKKKKQCEDTEVYDIIQSK